MIEKPEAIMTNIPQAYFTDGAKSAVAQAVKEVSFRRFYEGMGTRSEDDCFYHFISTVPVHQVNTVFICFNGLVQYKAIIVEFIKNKPLFLKNWEHPSPRNWMVTTGPVVKAPVGMTQKGFRGFRYCNLLF